MFSDLIFRVMSPFAKKKQQRLVLEETDSLFIPFGFENDSQIEIKRKVAEEPIFSYKIKKERKKKYLK